MTVNVAVRVRPGADAGRWTVAGVAVHPLGRVSVTSDAGTARLRAAVTATSTGRRRPAPSRRAR
ncbi:UNVERIFIED_ORG: hypothetical protein FHR35_001456 [Microbispora rosea subsp. rosea]